MSRQFHIDGSPSGEGMSDPKRARCFDPAWKYVPANATDIAKTFARIRRHQKEAEAACKAANVKPIRPKKEA